MCVCSVCVSVVCVCVCVVCVCVPISFWLLSLRGGNKTFGFRVGKAIKVWFKPIFTLSLTSLFHTVSDTLSPFCSPSIPFPFAD